MFGVLMRADSVSSHQVRRRCLSLSSPSEDRPLSTYADASGRKVKLPTMTFGHGAFRCPGERFTHMELVTTVTMFLTSYDFELVHPSAEEPQPHMSRVGFGVMPLDPKYSDHDGTLARFRRKPDVRSAKA